LRMSSVRERRAAEGPLRIGKLEVNCCHNSSFGKRGSKSWTRRKYLFKAFVANVTQQGRLGTINKMNGKRERGRWEAKD